MPAVDPRIPGIILLASTAAFVLVKRWTTGSFLKGKPEGSLLVWFTHVDRDIENVFGKPQGFAR